jgi:hypothetical protein
VDELVVTRPDDGLDQAPVGGGFHGQEMFQACGSLQQGCRGDPAEPQLAGDLKIGGQMGRHGDTADDNSALGRNTLGYFDSHDAAQGEADEDEGLRCIDLVDKPGGVVAEGFILLRWDPMDMGCPVAFGRADVGEHAVVGADAGNEICCHWLIEEHKNHAIDSGGGIGFVIGGVCLLPL